MATKTPAPTLADPVIEEKHTDYTKAPEYSTADPEYIEFKARDEEEDAVERETEAMLKEFEGKEVDPIRLIVLFKKAANLYEEEAEAAAKLTKIFDNLPTLKSYQIGYDTLTKAQQYGKRCHILGDMIKNYAASCLDKAFLLGQSSGTILNKPFEGSRSGGIFKVSEGDRFPLLKQMRLDLDQRDPLVIQALDKNNHRKLFSTCLFTKELYTRQGLVMPAWFVKKYGVLMRDEAGLKPAGAVSAQDFKNRQADKPNKKEGLPIKPRASPVPSAAAPGKIVEANKSTATATGPAKKKKNKKKNKAAAAIEELSQPPKSATAEEEASSTEEEEEEEEKPVEATEPTKKE